MCSSFRMVQVSAPCTVMPQMLHFTDFSPKFKFNLRMERVFLLNVSLPRQFWIYYPLSYGVPVRERYGSTLLPETREQHDQNCKQSH